MTTDPRLGRRNQGGGARQHKNWYPSGQAGAGAQVTSSDAECRWKVRVLRGWAAGGLAQGMRHRGPGWPGSGEEEAGEQAGEEAGHHRTFECLSCEMLTCYSG